MERWADQSSFRSDADSFRPHDFHNIPLFLTSPPGASAGDSPLPSPTVASFPWPPPSTSIDLETIPSNNGISASQTQTSSSSSSSSRSIEGPIYDLQHLNREDLLQLFQIFHIPIPPLLTPIHRLRERIQAHMVTMVTGTLMAQGGSPPREIVCDLTLDSPTTSRAASISSDDLSMDIIVVSTSSPSLRTSSSSSSSSS